MKSSNFSVILSFIAILFALIAIYTTRPYNWSSDFVGVIVTIITFLVTILIGWQIWELVKIHDIRKDLSCTEKNIRIEIQRSNKELDAKYRCEISNFISLIRAARIGIVNHLIMCFTVYNKNSDAPLSKTAALEFVIASFLELSNNEDKSKLQDIVETLSVELSRDEIEKMFHGYSSQYTTVDKKVVMIFLDLIQKSVNDQCSK